MLLSERGETSTLSAWAVEGGFGDAVSAGAIDGQRGLLLVGGSWGLGRWAQAKTENILARGDSCCAGESVVKFAGLRIFSE